MVRVFVVIFAAVSISACGTTDLESGSKFTRNGVKVWIKNNPCQKFVRYQDRSIKLATGEIPIGLLGTDELQIVKIEGVEISPTEVREVSKQIEQLDTRQYENCQALEKVDDPSEDLIERVIKSNNEFHTYVSGLIASAEE